MSKSINSILDFGFDHRKYTEALQAGIIKALNLFCDDVTEQNNNELS